MIKTPQELDDIVSQKIMELIDKYPQMCVEYLTEMHAIIDWAEKELKKLK